MQQLTDDDLLIPGGGSNLDEKERTVAPEMPSVRQARPDFSYFMSEELRWGLTQSNNLQFHTIIACPL